MQPSPFIRKPYTVCHTTNYHELRPYGVSQLVKTRDNIYRAFLAIDPLLSCMADFTQMVTIAVYFVYEIDG